MPSTPEVSSNPAAAPVGISMTSLRTQAVNMAMQLWIQHGVHPVQVRYQAHASGASEGVEATVCNASEAVSETGGDAYSLVARGVQQYPDFTHVFCVPHNTADGEILVIAEGGGEFSPGCYRIAVHPTLHNNMAEESARYLISQFPLDIQEGVLSSASLN